MQRLLEICADISSKLAKLQAQLDELCEDDDSEDDLAATQEDLDFIDDSPLQKKKRKTLGESRGQLKTYGANQGAISRGPSAFGYQPSRGRGLYFGRPQF